MCMALTLLCITFTSNMCLKIEIFAEIMVHEPVGNRQRSVKMRQLRQVTRSMGPKLPSSLLLRTQAQTEYPEIEELVNQRKRTRRRPICTPAPAHDTKFINGHGNNNYGSGTSDHGFLDDSRILPKVS